MHKKGFTKTKKQMIHYTTIALLPLLAAAFAPSLPNSMREVQLHGTSSLDLAHRIPKTSLQLFGSGEEGNDFLGNLFGGGSKNSDNGVVLSLPASTVKVGALRFLLNIYLVGEQNNPSPNSWLTRQDSEDNLQIYYSDGSAMLSLELGPKQIQAVRYGERPSLQYQLQESVLLHGVLDELESVAFGSGAEDEEIADDQRLLQFEGGKAIIEKARAKLPARQAS